MDIFLKRLHMHTVYTAYYTFLKLSSLSNKWNRSKTIYSLIFFILYILHTYIRLCGTVHLLEFDQKHSPPPPKKKRTDEEDIWTTTQKNKKIKILHATEVKKQNKTKQTNKKTGPSLPTFVFFCCIFTFYVFVCFVSVLLEDDTVIMGGGAWGGLVEGTFAF